MARRIGVVGAGFGTVVHVPGFRSEGWDVAALFSRNPERAKKAAEATGVPDVHTDPMELIQRDDLDAIAIATPPGQHHELAVAALQSGKHVMCEKPFAINATQAREMRDLAEKNGLTAMTVHELRYNPQNAFIKELLDGGYVGDFKVCEQTLFFNRGTPETPPPMTWNHLKSEGGGFLGAVGSHYIDGMRHWFGEIESVSGSLMTVRPDVTDPATGKVVQSETDDTFSFTLTFKSGGRANVSASSTLGFGGSRIVVMGTEGTLYSEQNGPNTPKEQVTFGSKNGQPPEPLERPERLTPFTDDRDPRLMAFRLLVRDFNRGIEEGVSPSPSFTDALRCQEVLDAVRESSETGKTVKVGS